LRQAKRHGWGLALLFIDIDKFKTVNDSYGHDLGDKVLLMMAHRLQSFLRDEDTVSRWGGDEFVCLLLEVKQESDVIQLAQQMVNRIAEACEFDGIVLFSNLNPGLCKWKANQGLRYTGARVPVQISQHSAVLADRLRMI
jgi:GGDEF domain-containing protein